jgi:hypothetical protein
VDRVSAPDGVRVGNESRAFAVHGCIYGLEVDVEAFSTFGPYNNKVLKKTDDGQWRQRDVGEKKFENEPLKYLRQQGQYYYFEQITSERPGNRRSTTSRQLHGWTMAIQIRSDLRLQDTLR